MENLEGQQYRDNLAESLRSEPDKIKRREILEGAQDTDAYQEAKRLRGADTKRPFWGEFRGGEVDDVGECKEPTPEQREKFEKRNERMAELFEGADFEWFLDGAVNISLYGDKQIRDHKDLDMSVFRADLEKLERLLVSNGFTIALNYTKDGKNLLKKVTSAELAQLDRPDLSICKVDQTGAIDRKSPDPFNFVDLHIHDKDEGGNTIINYNGSALPKEFFEPVKKKLQSGREINLSQPAIVAYHKLHSERPYDLTDLEKLAPNLHEKYFAMLRTVLEKEMEDLERRTKDKLKELWDLIYPLLGMTRNTKAISEKILTHPDVAKRMNEQVVEEYVTRITKYLSENENTSLDKFLEISLSILKPREHVEKKLKVLDKLEKDGVKSS